MKTNQVKLWKKILISAWTLVGLGVFIFFVCLASVRIEDRLDNKRWYYQTTINDSLRLDKDYPDKEYVRIYNLNTPAMYHLKCAGFHWALARATH